MSTVLLVHGIQGSSQENWFPWLKKELEEHGHRAIVPDFPHSDTPVLHEWLEHAKRYEDSIDENSIIVGHSLGGAFALRFLETRATPVRATFLVAPVTGPEDGLDYAPKMTTFLSPAFDWHTIRKNGGAFHIIHADNDPFVVQEHAEELAKNLEITPKWIAGGGHLNASAGFTEFPALRDLILAQL